MYFSPVHISKSKLLTEAEAKHVGQTKSNTFMINTLVKAKDSSCRCMPNLFELLSKAALAEFQCTQHRAQVRGPPQILGKNGIP